MITARAFALIAAAGSAALLLGAFGFQYLGGYAPCEICLWQRWPHAAAVGIGLLVLLGAPRAVYGLGALAAAATGAIGVYHTGIERSWWPGPSSCTGSGTGLGGLSGTDLLNFDAAPPLIMCDQVSWQMFGLSMASWNALASCLFAVLWIVALRRD